MGCEGVVGCPQPGIVPDPADDGGGGGGLRRSRLLLAPTRDGARRLTRAPGITDVRRVG